MRDNQYTIDGRIRFSEVDHTRRITLPGIVNYFQDCSTFQSEDLGLGIEHCSEKKRAWILSSWLCKDLSFESCFFFKFV